ncbi:Sensor protein GacS [Talaromyces pinophilus]|nr:Sensor protein GacS [Talaromyces pinophilus]
MAGRARKYAYNPEGARERETHLYLPYWGFSNSEKFAQESIGRSPNASRDSVLTVFAQLGALRMNAQRAMISLFDKETQYVIAEATPICSLRGENSREQTNGLWVGVGRFSSPKSTMCYHAMRSFVEGEEKLFVVNDLAKDRSFSDHLSVSSPPHNKFYVSVPIRSPDHYVIGTVAVLDDKPREDGISAEQGDFLEQLAATVMDYLSSQRAMREEYREEKMVRALGLFVKGKSDSNEDFDRDKPPDASQRDQMGNVNNRLEQLQVSSPGDSGEERPEAQNEQLPTDGKNNAESPIQKFAGEEKEQESPPSGCEDGSEAQERKQRPALSPTTSQLKESLAPSNVQSVVNRAAAMIYQALDLEGVMFVDASIYARRQTVGSNKLDYRRDAYTVENQDRKPSGQEDIPSTKNPDSRLDSSSSDDNGESRSLVLGHHTSSTSKAGVSLNDSHYVSLAGSFIGHLIKQYPHGKIFHIEPDGSISLSYEGASDVLNYSDKGRQDIPASDIEEVNIKQETMDIKQLMEVLPNARCIAIYPIYDFQRGRYFSVSIVWTNDPGRVLSEPKDLTYLAAFSHTVMAEVSRLDLEATVRAKGDFISSISHELRSPLHGLLGSVELLQEIVGCYAERSLVETVYSCGRTLLDTLNHLLDYAKINTLTRQATSDTSNQKGLSELQPATSGLKQDENLDVLVQEVVEGILAGIEYQRREAAGGSNHERRGADDNTNSDTNRQLMTIVDVEWLESWRHSIYAGAWRRVVMNLFGNALKYTQSGYIRLLMKKDKLKVDGKDLSAIRMTFSDSGRGMSKDFILNHLYTAFHQEDATAPGLGVGLHLVHQIVKSMSGTIEIASEPGKGTDVDIVLPIDPPEQSVHPPSSNHESLKEQLEGKTISLFTRSSKLGDMGIDSKQFDTMLTSLGRMATSWFGLQVVTPDEHGYESVDFAIVTEHEYRTYYLERSREPKEEDSQEIRPLYPLIVLSERISSWKTTNETVENSVIFLTQPVSPKTLAMAFKHCLSSPARVENPRLGNLSSPVQTINGGQNSNEKHENEITEPEVPAMDNTTEHSKGARNILLVEDNQVNLKVIEMCAKATGFTYQTADNGLAAVEKFKKERFDVVIMDVSMPVMDGLSATREIRQFERRSKRPRTTIIALTAVLSASTQHEALASGVDLFLTKPAPLKQLKEMLRSLSEGNDISEK